MKVLLTAVLAAITFLTIVNSSPVPQGLLDTIAQIETTLVNDLDALIFLLNQDLLGPVREYISLNSLSTLFKM